MNKDPMTQDQAKDLQEDLVNVFAAHKVRVAVGLCNYRGGNYGVRLVSSDEAVDAVNTSKVIKRREAEVNV